MPASLLLLLPIIGAAIIALLSNDKPRIIRQIAMATSAISFLYSIYLILYGDVTLNLMALTPPHFLGISFA